MGSCAEGSDRAAEPTCHCWCAALSGAWRVAQRQYGTAPCPRARGQFGRERRPCYCRWRMWGATRGRCQRTDGFFRCGSRRRSCWRTGRLSWRRPVRGTTGVQQQQGGSVLIGEAVASAAGDGVFVPALRIRPPAHSEAHTASNSCAGTSRHKESSPRKLVLSGSGIGSKSTLPEGVEVAALPAGEAVSGQSDGYANSRGVSKKTMPSAQPRPLESQAQRSPPRPPPAPAQIQQMLLQQPPQVLQAPPAQFVVRGSFPSSAAPSNLQVGMQTPATSAQHQAPPRVFSTSGAPPQATVQRATLSGYPTAANQARVFQRMAR